MANSKVYQRISGESEQVRTYKRIIRVVAWLWHQNDRNGATRIAFQTSSAVCGNLRHFWIVKVQSRPFYLCQHLRKRYHIALTNLGHVPSPDPPRCRDPSCVESWRKDKTRCYHRRGRQAQKLQYFRFHSIYCMLAVMLTGLYVCPPILQHFRIRAGRNYANRIGNINSILARPIERVNVEHETFVI
jgi:hypothetical protein